MRSTAVSAIASQDLDASRGRRRRPRAAIHAGGALLTHYGSPVVTTNNTVVIPVKTAPPAAIASRRDGRTGGAPVVDGHRLRHAAAQLAAALQRAAHAAGRLYAPGAGGKLLVEDDADAASSTLATHVFYGAAAYNANPARFDGSVFINTPVTADAQGNVFFGFLVTGANPAGLVSGIARVAPTARHLGRRRGCRRRPFDPEARDELRAGALERRRHGLHRGQQRAGAGVAEGLPARARQHDARRARRALLIDPNTGTPARVSDDGTASPVVGPDGRVFYGVLERRSPRTTRAAGCCSSMRCSRRASTPGSFGWDDRRRRDPGVDGAVVRRRVDLPARAEVQQLPRRRHGRRANRLAVLDPSATQADPICRACR